jgi:N-acetylmuramic acid 6-phosphate etherase
MNRWRTLLTEGRHPDSEALDTMTSEEVVTLLLEEDKRGLDAALAQRKQIAQAAIWAAEALEAGGSVAFAGAGTSGRLGILEAAECPPTFGSEPEQIRAQMAGGEDAMFRAKEGAEDREDQGREAVAELGADDLLIGLSASSVTRYVQGAILQAREQGARTVLLTCAAADGLGEAADLVIGLATGPEILTGSTRLKAGSATKAALNAITTAAMVRLGKTYGNLMVDLRPGSAKLEDRALRIIEAAAEVPAEEAAQLHLAANGNVKVAILMGKLEISAFEARDKLEASSGHLRRALEG